jgi:hypothetical protein
MDQDLFFKTISEKSKELKINPLLILSGIEGLYTFRDMQLNAINYNLLDSLILTIFALRIGDQFHALAEENLASNDLSVQLAAINEIAELRPDEIRQSQNPYLESFAQLLGGKTPVRNYHLKALEVAAVEIKKAQITFENDSIGIIMLAICKDDPNDSLGLAAIFNE